MNWGNVMRKCRRAFAAAAVLAMLAGSAAGCAGRSSQGAASAAAVPPTPSGASTSTVESTATSDAGALLRQLQRPESAGDSGYELLGADHNSDAAWTRATVLSVVDYGSLVSSIASQQVGIDVAALQAFRVLLASRGATATYDAVLDSQWRIQDGKATKDDKQLVTLIPASTTVGLLLDRTGRLFGRYSLREASVDGDVLSASYVRPGKPDATLRFRVVRAPAGGLRIAEWVDYAAFRSGLQGDEAAADLP